MINFIRRHYRIVALFIVLLFAAVFFFMITRRSQPHLTPPPEFQLKNIYPGTGKINMAFPSTAISLVFSSSIDKSTLKVNIDPAIKTQTYTDSTDRTLYIMPVPNWEIGTKYNISVSVKSKYGQDLTSPISFTFEPTSITESSLQEIPAK